MPYSKDLTISIPVRIETTVTVGGPKREPRPWHRHEWRCRLALWLYGLSRLADKIDPPRRHL